MSVYDNDEIRVEGAVNVRQLRQFYMKEKLNEHMVFFLSGNISREDAAEYENSRLLGQVIRIYGPCGKEDIIGFGLVNEVEIIYKGTYSIQIKGTSLSWSIDNKKNKRSFQNSKWTYWEIIKKISGKNTEIIYRCNKDETLKMPVIQYQETDWAFLKRLAGRLETVLIPDVHSHKPRIFFGLPQGTAYNLSEYNDIQLCIKKCGGTKKKYYNVTGIKTNMRLGDSIMLENKNWTIVQKEVRFINGKLEMQYVIGRIQDWVIPFTCNCNLRGEAIKGRVLARNNEQLKLWLEIDSEQKSEDAYWYQYLPETGNLLYAMPEEGTESVLYFPDGEEKNGIVTHGFHKQGYQEYEKNHNIKEIATSKKKGIRFWPGMIEIFGGKDKITNKLYLGEDTGLQFSTKKSLRIMAEDSISIQSGLACSATAINYISITQLGGKNSIEMSGNQIMFRAEKYYTASRLHQSKTLISDREKEPEFESYSHLYGKFTGMMAQGDSGNVNQKILGAIPTLGSLNNEIRIQNQIGLRINRKK